MRVLSKYTKYEGSDACLKTSLFEYDIIWRVGKSHTKFIFLVGHKNKTPLFYTAEVGNDIDIKDVWGWINWDDFFSFIGDDEENWNKRDLPHKVYDLYTYYGYEELFGSAYSCGFHIAEGN